MQIKFLRLGADVPGLKYNKIRECHVRVNGGIAVLNVYVGGSLYQNADALPWVSVSPFDIENIATQKCI